MAADLSFPAMGTTAQVIVVGDPSLSYFARRRVDDLEQRWSRFVVTSEVSALNASRGQPLRVSSETFRLVSAAVEGWARTAGRFDPTVLGDVVRAGYDQTYDVIAARGGGGVSALHRDAGGIGLDPSRSEVTLPRHVGFDPGAIGKGLAADIVVEELMAAGAEGACVNLGGDLRVEGLAPMGERRWVVAIDHGADVADLHHLHIGLEAGGVATSTTARRVWSDGDRRMHHIIDPTSGRPSAGAETVTALARTAAGAEVAATSSMLAGEDEALAALTELGADGIVRLATGERLVTDNLRHFRLASLAS